MSLQTTPYLTLTLALSARADHLAVVMSFVETSAAVFGLGRPEQGKLLLATEEIFMYLSGVVCPGKDLEVRLVNGLYYVCAEFRFASPELDLGGLNITSTISYDGEADLQQMGLLIASRSVDRLSLSVERQRVALAVTKEKVYPRSTETLPSPEAGEGTAVETPDRERLKRFAVLARQALPDPDRPSFLDYPGKLVDMAAAGDCQVLTAFGEKKDIVGGILFGHRTEKTVWCCGPYVFSRTRQAETAAALLAACIAKIARTKALGLLSLSGLPEGLRADFEPLGSLTFRPAEGPPVARPFFYRHLHEDPVCEVWTHAELADHLRREYDRLVLAREIRLLTDMGEARSGRSLFSAEVNGERSEVVLRPELPGADYAANVERHVRFLRGDRYRNLLFELDLGVPWHAELVPALLHNGFHPAILLPFAGHSDLVIFEAHETEP
ncbi:MAG: hypothetical protein A4E73_00082 [Syntrophaceae bacterium PtaU1.Bin231]|nr:MAG: hypothetical protein A4E73_00082 [Syntrophaceae bacterium PtaU1.Bin231]HOG16578.1 hypothetical protein [Syntrophales bacterium]